MARGAEAAARTAASGWCAGMGRDGRTGRFRWLPYAQAPPASTKPSRTYGVSVRTRRQNIEWPRTLSPKVEVRHSPAARQPERRLCGEARAGSGLGAAALAMPSASVPKRGNRNRVASKRTLSPSLEPDPGVTRRRRRASRSTDHRADPARPCAAGHRCSRHPRACARYRRESVPRTARATGATRALRRNSPPRL